MDKSIRLRVDARFGRHLDTSFALLAKHAFHRLNDDRHRQVDGAPPHLDRQLEFDEAT
jgi:hypothetical protein